jgi:hypothetical protein
LQRIAGYVGQVVAIGQKQLERANELEKLGFSGFDAAIWHALRAAKRTYFYQPMTACSNAQNALQRRFT